MRATVSLIAGYYQTIANPPLMLIT
jgi:hypothetical protein